MSWSSFDAVRPALRARKLVTYAQMFTSLGPISAQSKNVVVAYVVLDDLQAIGVAHGQPQSFGA